MQVVCVYCAGVILAFDMSEAHTLDSVRYEQITVYCKFALSKA